MRTTLKGNEKFRIVETNKIYDKHIVSKILIVV